MGLAMAPSCLMTLNVLGMNLTCLSVDRKPVLMTAHMMKMLLLSVWVSYHLYIIYSIYTIGDGHCSKYFILYVLHKLSQSIKKVLIVLIASCQVGRVRIIVGDSDEDFYTMSNDLRQSDYDSAFLVIDDMLSRGRIEVCNGMEYEAVCADGWDYTDASVVCRELGFSPYGSL